MVSPFFILYRDRNLLNNVRERKPIIAKVIKITTITIVIQVT